jgi:hypothetical protein
MENIQTPEQIKNEEVEKWEELIEDYSKLIEEFKNDTSEKAQTRVEIFKANRAQIEEILQNLK